MSGCSRDVLEGDPSQAGQGMFDRGDQHRVEAERRVVGNVIGHADQRPDREIDGVVPQELEAVAARDVVQPEFDRRVALGELADDLRQDIEDGRFTGRDVEPAAGLPMPAGGERRRKRIDSLDQRAGQLVKGLAVGGEPDLRSAAVEQARSGIPAPATESGAKPSAG